MPTEAWLLQRTLLLPTALLVSQQQQGAEYRLGEPHSGCLQPKWHVATQLHCVKTEAYLHDIIQVVWTGSRCVASVIVSVPI